MKNTLLISVNFEVKMINYYVQYSLDGACLGVSKKQRKIYVQI